MYADGVYHQLTQDSGLSVERISADGNIVCVATTDGAYLYQDGVVNWIADSIGSNVISICGDGANTYYADSTGAVYVFDGAESRGFYHDTKIKTVKIFQNAVWLGSAYGDLIRVAGDEIMTFKVVDNMPINALEPQSDCLFVGTDGGLSVCIGRKMHPRGTFPKDY